MIIDYWPRGGMIIFTMERAEGTNEMNDTLNNPPISHDPFKLISAYDGIFTTFTISPKAKSNFFFEFRHSNSTCYPPTTPFHHTNLIPSFHPSSG